MTEFQYKLKLILAGNFEFTDKEKEELYDIWSIEDTPENDIVLTDKYAAQKKYHEKIKDDVEFKKKQKEYMARYYREVRCKGKKIREKKTPVDQRARMKELNSRPCIYEGKEVRFNTLVIRLHNKNGLSFHDANILAKKYLKENE